jgi:hypothetical protein
MLNNTPFSHFREEENMPSNTTSNQTMKLSIKDDLKLAALQAEFHNYFQYLKIEFLKRSHKIGEVTAKNLVYDKNKHVRDCRILHVNEDYFFTEKTTVSDFENTLLKVYGLSIQIFRKSGNVWLETSATDSWTLRQQNDEGAELSAPWSE